MEFNVYNNTQNYIVGRQVFVGIDGYNLRIVDYIQTPFVSTINTLVGTPLFALLEYIYSSSNYEQYDFKIKLDAFRAIHPKANLDSLNNNNYLNSIIVGTVKNGHKKVPKSALKEKFNLLYDLLAKDFDTIQYLRLEPNRNCIMRTLETIGDGFFNAVLGNHNYSRRYNSDGILITSKYLFCINQNDDMIPLAYISVKKEYVKHVLMCVLLGKDIPTKYMTLKVDNYLANKTKDSYRLRKIFNTHILSKALEFGIEVQYFDDLYKEFYVAPSTSTLIKSKGELLQLHNNYKVKNRVEPLSETGVVGSGLQLDLEFFDDVGARIVSPETIPSGGIFTASQHIDAPIYTYSGISQESFRQALRDIFNPDATTPIRYGTPGIQSEEVEVNFSQPF